MRLFHLDWVQGWSATGPRDGSNLMCPGSESGGRGTNLDRQSTTPQPVSQNISSPFKQFYVATSIILKDFAARCWPPCHAFSQFSLDPHPRRHGRVQGSMYPLLNTASHLPMLPNDKPLSSLLVTRSSMILLEVNPFHLKMSEDGHNRKICQFLWTATPTHFSNLKTIKIITQSWWNLVWLLEKDGI